MAIRGRRPVIVLALHTRIEAWFLLAPLGVWMGMSWWQSRAARPRLVLGTLLCLAITPLFIFTVNVTLLAHHYQWELGRLSPFLLVEKWIHAAGHERIGHGASCGARFATNCGRHSHSPTEHVDCHPRNTAR